MYQQHRFCSRETVKNRMKTFALSLHFSFQIAILLPFPSYGPCTLTISTSVFSPLLRLPSSLFALSDRYTFTLLDLIPLHSYHFHLLSLSLSLSLSPFPLSDRHTFALSELWPLHSHHLHLGFLSPFFWRLCSLLSFHFQMTILLHLPI